MCVGGEGKDGSIGLGSELTSFLGVDQIGLLFCIVASLVGAVIKGYSGFGASMLWVTSLSLVLPPLQVVPMALFYEIATSLHLMPAIRREIDWRSVRLLLGGTALATPIGVYGLSAVPADPARIAVASVVIVAAAMLWHGFALAKVPGTAATLVIGLFAGLLNGSMGFVGPAVVLFYLSSPIAVTISRASIIAFFLGTGTIGAISYTAQGLVTTDVFLRIAILLPVVLIGNWLGHRHFTDTPPDSFRRFALILLTALSLALIARALWL